MGRMQGTAFHMSVFSLHSRRFPLQLHLFGRPLPSSSCTVSRRAGGLAASTMSEGALTSPDLLFDLFEFGFSPLGAFLLLFGATGSALLWLTANAGKLDGEAASSQRQPGGQQMGTNEARQWEERVEEPLPRFLPPPSSPETAYLEMRLRLAKQSAEEEAEMGTRFVVRFSSKSDAFYENPVRGGTYRIKAGLPYVEEFESLAGCSALGQALQRRLGSDKVEFQAFEVRGKDWFPRFASSWAPPQWASNGGDMAGAPEGSRDRVGVVGEEAEEENSVDREWKVLMEEAKLLTPRNSGLDVTVITSDTACQLCNGRGFRGCAKCSTPAVAGIEKASFRPDEFPDSMGACRTCFGKRLVPCDWCMGSGLRSNNA